MIKFFKWSYRTALADGSHAGRLMATTGASPQRIMELSWSYSITRTLIAAVELQLFTHLTRGARTVSELARATSTSPRGIRMLADALVGLGLLKKVGQPYRLTPESSPVSEPVVTHSAGRYGYARRVSGLAHNGWIRRDVHHEDQQPVACHHRRERPRMTERTRPIQHHGQER
jgi:hypothetical protein